MAETTMKHMDKIFWRIFSVLVFMLPLFVFGQTQTGGGGNGNTSTGGSGAGNTQTGGGIDGIQNPLRFENLIDFLGEVLTIVRNIGFMVAVVMIVYSGFLFVTAQGNDTKLQKAKSAFLWTLVGTAVLLGAWIFAVALQNTVDALKA